MFEFILPKQKRMQTNWFRQVLIFTSPLTYILPPLVAIVGFFAGFVGSFYLTDRWANYQPGLDRQEVRKAVVKKTSGRKKTVIESEVEDVVEE